MDALCKARVILERFLPSTAPFFEKVPPPPPAKPSLSYAYSSTRPSPLPSGDNVTFSLAFLALASDGVFLFSRIPSLTRSFCRNEGCSIFKVHVGCVVTLVFLHSSPPLTHLVKYIFF